jgi:predicted transcriptional regulator
MPTSKQLFSHLIQLKPKPTRMPSIGNRELEILQVLWNEQPNSLSAIAVQDKLVCDMSMSTSAITVNTVQSTLERLVKKCLLRRSKKGRAFYYQPLVPKQQVIARLIRDIAADMTKGDMGLMISGFMDFVTDEDPDLSEKLSQAFERINYGDDDNV